MERRALLSARLRAELSKLVSLQIRAEMRGFQTPTLAPLWRAWLFSSRMKLKAPYLIKLGGAAEFGELQRITDGKVRFVAALLQWIEPRGWQLMWGFQQLDYCWESWCPSEIS